MHRSRQKRKRRDIAPPKAHDQTEEESSEEEIDQASSLRRCFTPLSTAVKLQAVGKVEAGATQDYWFHPGDDFEEFPLPNHRDDYLAQHKSTIYLVPVGEFSAETQNLQFDFLEALKDFTSHFYLGMKVTLLPPVDLCLIKQENEEEEETMSAYLEYTPPASSPLRRRKHRADIVVRRAHEYDIEDALPDARQLYIDSVCNFLVKIKPKDARCLVGVTMEDLYCSTDDSFTMGLAHSGRVGLFSFGRYHPGKVWKQSDLEARERAERRKRRRRRKGRPTKKQKQKVEEATATKKQQELYVLLNRSCKVLVHELGHLFGIGHCIFWNCCMNGSGHLEEDYRQAMHLCPVDLHKLQHCLGFDVVERYRRMETFYRQHVDGFEEELKWVQQRLCFLLEQQQQRKEGEREEEEEEKDEKKEKGKEPSPTSKIVIVLE
ncbi:metallopeptidase [Balamuthia mandrillaris]